MTRADVAAEHESRGAIGPTFENVWTTGFLANCVQVEPFDQLQYLVLICRVAQADAQPFRLGLADFLIVTDYTEFAGQIDYLCEDFTWFGGVNKMGQLMTRIWKRYKLSAPELRKPLKGDPRG